MGRPVLVLPEETQVDLRRLHGMDDPVLLNTYLAQLADAGWGYQPSATALGMHRQSIRQRAAQGLNVPLGPPQLPIVPEPPRKSLPTSPAISGPEANRLRRLNGLAQKLRPEHGPKDPHRRASEELSAFIDALTKRGVQYKQIGAVLGIKPMTVRARLKRHGYRRPNPALKPYQGKRPNREDVPA